MSIDFNRNAHTAKTSQTETYERLIWVLRDWDILYLMTGDTPKDTIMPLSPIEVVTQLAACEDPRVRDASISLFLLHPELASVIVQAYHKSLPFVAEQIAVLTLATLYLQRLWSFRLTVALGHTPQFPEQPFEFLWKKYTLPAPACGHGKDGLFILQEREQTRYGFPINSIGDWQNQIDHLLLQEEAKHDASSVVPRLILQVDEEQEEKDCHSMSMRTPVTKAEIEKFLQALGRSFRKPGRLYLAGGASLVHMGLRKGATVDIDVALDAVDEDEMVTAIRRIVDQMQINVEFASPEDFIPIPSQWRTQARFVGRYGMLDVFYFDFYSLALSKISRGNDRDLLDVKLLLQQKVITLERLDAAYQEVLPRMGKRPYLNVNPERFANRYGVVRQQLQP